MSKLQEVAGCPGMKWVTKRVQTDNVLIAVVANRLPQLPVVYMEVSERSTSTHYLTTEQKMEMETICFPSKTCASLLKPTYFKKCYIYFCVTVFTVSQLPDQKLASICRQASVFQRNYVQSRRSASKQTNHEKVFGATPYTFL